MRMALTVEVVIYLGLALLIFGFLVRMTMKARATQEETVTKSDSPHDRMLLRFVLDAHGKRMGETVAVDGSDFIVKDARGFLAVPTAQVADQSGELRLEGALDEDEARRKGEAWRARSHKVITYSESELPKDDPEG